MDFERDALAERLAASGHASDQPTAWIWEGVTPYLRPPAIEATLADVAARSAAGSRLLVSYAVPELTPWDLPGLHALTRAGFAALGEPLRGPITTEALAATLAAHGFALRDDSGNAQWARRYGGSARLARTFSAERLEVAERSGG